VQVFGPAFSQHDPGFEVFPLVPGIAVFGSDFPGAAALGEWLRLLLPVMSESRAPIYPPKSKSVLRFPRKRVDGQLNKSLIAESLAAFTASPPLLCPLYSPPMETVAASEPLVTFVRHGFLLPHSLSSLPFEVGESSRGVDSEEAVSSPEAMFDVTLCLQAAGIYFEGNKKGFLDVKAQVVEGQRLEVSISIPKIKGNRELHNLECDINYDARSLDSTRGKSKRALL
jgi:hypothetical protein